MFEKYDWDVEMAMDIAWAESDCNPKFHNWKDKHKTCLGSWNLMQVGCLHYKKGESRDNIALNIAKAYRIYSDRNDTFRAWTTCKKVAGCLQ